MGLFSGVNTMPPNAIPVKNTATTIQIVKLSFRREKLDPRSCLSKSSQSRSSMEISFAGKCPKKNPEKGLAFPLLSSNEFVPKD